jgi:hypothetical protein
MTADDVRRALGLEPFAAFAEKRRAANAAKGLKGDELVRATGRTTALICEGVARLDAGQRVVVDAADVQGAEIIADAIRAAAKELGVDAGPTEAEVTRIGYVGARSGKVLAVVRTWSSANGGEPPADIPLEVRRVDRARLRLTAWHCGDPRTVDMLVDHTEIERRREIQK